MMTIHRLFFLLIAMLFVQVLITAQDNQEPIHAHFRAESERQIPLDLEDMADQGKEFVANFSYQPQWNGKQVFVRIPGTHLPYTLHINDFRFGSDPGSREVAVFNLTPFLKEGTNRLRLHFPEADSDGSAVPCLFYGDPLLVVRDAIHVRDHDITVYHSPESTEVLVRFHVFVKSYLSEKNKGRELEIRVTGPEGDQVVSESRALDFPLAFGQETEMVFDRTLDNPVIWSTAAPSLYTTSIRISERKEGSSESITSTFGIRTAYLSDSLLIQNGDSIPVIHAGESLVDSLYCLPDEEIRDLVAERDFNAIHTGDPLPYRLVDLLGKHGVIVIRKTGRMDPQSGRTLINCPSVVWTE